MQTVEVRQTLLAMGDEAERATFVNELMEFWLYAASPLTSIPTIQHVTVDLFKLYQCVTECGGGSVVSTYNT